MFNLKLFSVFLLIVFCLMCFWLFNALEFIYSYENKSKEYQDLPFVIQAHNLEFLEKLHNEFTESGMTRSIELFTNEDVVVNFNRETGSRLIFEYLEMEKITHQLEFSLKSDFFHSLAFANKKNPAHLFSVIPHKYLKFNETDELLKKLNFSEFEETEVMKPKSRINEYREKINKLTSSFLMNSILLFLLINLVIILSAVLQINSIKQRILNALKCGVYGKKLRKELSFFSVKAICLLLILSVSSSYLMNYFKFKIDILSAVFNFNTVFFSLLFFLAIMSFTIRIKVKSVIKKGIIDDEIFA